MRSEAILKIQSPFVDRDDDEIFREYINVSAPSFYAVVTFFSQAEENIFDN